MRRLASLLAVAGCAGDPEAGAVAASWRTGALTCEEAGLTAVGLELYGFDDVAPAASARAPCSAGRQTLEDVSPGGYTLWLSGLDAAGCATHEARADLRVRSGETHSADELTLLPRRRVIDLRWPFADRSRCPENDVQQVRVDLDGAADFRLQEVFLCEDGGRRLDGLPPGPFSVRLTAVDVSGAPIARGSATFGAELFTEAPCPDAVVEVRVPLEACPRPGCP